MRVKSLLVLPMLFVVGCGSLSTPIPVTVLEPCPIVAPKPRCDVDNTTLAKPEDKLALVVEYLVKHEAHVACIKEVENWRNERAACEID